MGTMSVEFILSICGGISIIGGALAIVWKVIKPMITIVKKFEQMDQAYKDYSERLDTLEAMQKVQSRCLAAILDHMITGNGIEHMKDIKEDLLTSIIDK